MSAARRLCGALAAALLVASCTAARVGEAPEATGSSSPDRSASSAESSAPKGVRAPSAPPAGACYRMSFAEAKAPSNASQPVHCAERHQTQTISVGELDTVVNGHALAVDSEVVVQQLARTCPRAMAAHLGGSVEDRRLSRLRAVWFAPTLEQADRGARWYRCDVVAVAGQDRLFALPSPSRLRGILERSERAAPYALCGTTAPGDSDFTRVICARPHRWRAVATIDIGGSSGYPGQAAVRKAGDERCRGLVRAREGQPLRFRYGWEWPTRQQWDTGQRYGFCWAPD